MAGDSLGAVLAALSDETRRRVVHRLSEHGPATASQLAAELPITRQAVSKHLVALQEARLVESQRHGREIRYQLTPAPLSEVMSWMALVGAKWDERLQALQEYLESNA
ncbi:MAG: metalloregulator ArsR/SmtB family transcription factor [Actinomycetota bacterium]|nr:metalloregulator ArsR/SmtB family transcription factor [Actinomycetota bacterium]